MPVPASVAGDLVSSLSGLIRTARSFVHLNRERLGPSGVPLSLLGKLGNNPVRATDLACHLGVTPSSVSRALSALEQHGYVTRTPDPTDARAHLVSLTDAGRLVVDAQRRDYAELLGEMLKDWDDAEAAEAARLLAKLDAAFARTVQGLRQGGMPLSTQAAQTLESSFATTTCAPSDHSDQHSPLEKAYS